ncbi:ABC transporter substrate-binding protein [Cryptosporangium phraense]|uniref:Thiamine pyrimidine synthase n=1 Tax=Cryptosporangium phraense TaxID=2593070 RepID=A0A545AHL8_9ACTN|nr:ABC transporter substrate-binding protein [Cryptosporangium phraense]TQS40185.1 ABC transporter substrate-binding protein [Cryptosporangium phraense]
MNSARFSRRSILRAGALGGLAFGAAGVLAACGDDSSDASGSSSGTKGDYGTISLNLSWIKNHEFVGEYLATEKGYYTAAGFKDVMLVAGGTQTTAESLVLAGKVTIGLSSPPITAATLVNSNAPLKIIGATYQKNPFAIGSIETMTPIRTAKDLIGKRIGVQAGGNQTLFEGLLAANGIDKSQVEIVGVQYDDSILKAGKVDGFMTYITDDLQLSLAGYKPVIMSFADNGLPFVAETFTVLQDTITKKRDMLKAFLVAEIKGWTHAIKDPATAATLTVEKYGKDQKLTYADEYGGAVEIADRLIVSDDTNANGLFTMTDALIADNIKSLNTMGYPVKADDLFDLSLITEVYQENPDLKASITAPTDPTPSPSASS